MKKSKFTTLDGLRGIAAITVMAYHYCDQADVMGSLKLFPGGWLAVDLFFVLSGFVLAHAYEARFAAGLTTGRFMLLRMIRLYPLYLAGLFVVIGAQTLLWWKGYYHHGSPWARMLPEMAVGLFFLPVLSPGVGFYPLNGPAWSLFLEIIANFFYRLGFRYLRWVVLGGIVTISFIGILIFPDQGDLGVRSIGAYLSRVGFSFFAGVMVYRFWQASDFRPKLSPWLVVAAMMAIFSLPSSRLDFFAFPILVYLGACVEPEGITQTLFNGLGGISYAVYMLQIPLLTVMRVVWAKFIPLSMSSLAPWTALPLMGTVMLTASVLDRVYDTPLRKWLTGLGRKRSIPSGNAVVELSGRA